MCPLIYLCQETAMPWERPVPAPVPGESSSHSRSVYSAADPPGELRRGPSAG